MKFNICLCSCLCFYLSSYSQCCFYRLTMLDSYGDGWNGGFIEVYINGNLTGTFQAANFALTDSFQVCAGDFVELDYTAGSYENENSYSFFDASWNLVFNDGPDPQTGLVYNGTGSCSTTVIPGNHPCNAIPVDTGTCVVYNNSTYTGSGLNPGCAQMQGHDMWFTMLVPPSGNLLLETDSGSINDTGIGLWTGNLCSNLQPEGCDDDGGVGYFSRLPANELTPGSRIYIQVFGYQGATGSFRLCIHDLGVIAPDSSALPIILINTLGQIIVEDTKINALMDIKYNGPGNITSFSDPSNVYSGNIGIEIRGATSAGYPQKPYNIETRNSVGANNNISLLGMPPENDWVLLSNYNDRSLIRNTLAYKLFGEMGNYSIRTQLCEVMVDSIYKGIYVFGEKIKRDSGRVHIASLALNDTAGDALTGGYILQQNYWNSSNSFQSAYGPVDHPGFDIHFVYEYPDPDVILPVQKSYIAAFVDSLEDALYSTNFMDPVNGYRKYLDSKSFIDYFIVNELARNNDGFKKSVFFHKDKHSNSGKMKAGPVWDFDWAWKNLYGCAVMENTTGAGWAHHINDCPTDNYSCGWYIRLLQDSSFANELRCRYELYRSTMLDTTALFSYIDSIRFLVQGAAARHFQKWPLMGVSGPAPEIGNVAITYNAELDSLKWWITKRLNWLDANVPGDAINCMFADEVSKPIQSITFYPNPADNFLFIKGPGLSENTCTFILTDLFGKEVAGLAANKINDPLYTGNLTPGLYIGAVLNSGQVVCTGKIVISPKN